MTPSQIPYGLRWILGIPFRSREYGCPDCGLPADPLGIHAVTCQRSGEISRSHHKACHCLGGLYDMAGGLVDYEYTSRLPNYSSTSSSRPADVAVAWRGTRWAFDITVVTPVRKSARPGQLLLDQAAVSKVAKNTLPCTAKGLTCQPFVMDCFGAVRSDARRHISELIAHLAKRLEPSPPAWTGRGVWAGITGAAVARAAIQLQRHALLDWVSSAGPGGLDLRTTRLPHALLAPCLPPSADHTQGQGFQPGPLGAGPADGMDGTAEASGEGSTSTSTGTLAKILSVPSLGILRPGDTNMTDTNGGDGVTEEDTLEDSSSMSTGTLAQLLPSSPSFGPPSGLSRETR